MTQKYLYKVLTNGHFIDHKRNDTSCKSVQTVFAYIMGVGFAYAMDIRQFFGEKVAYQEDLFRLTIIDYNNDFDNVFTFTKETFKNIKDNPLEQFYNTKKIVTS